MSVAAAGRPLVEMGARRTHEQAAPAAARAAFIAGFDSTSDLAAGLAYGIPTVGTAAHAFTLAHTTEREAFAAQVAAMGPQTTLLVDTYDTAAGIRTAVEVAGPDLGAIRIDSGELGGQARGARKLLDELGATGTRIIVTSDLDEYAVESLADAPIDAFGVGTRVVTGSGHPTAGLVYKLVAVAGAGWGGPGSRPSAVLRPVAKESEGKANVGGAKRAYRETGPDGRACSELVVTRPELRPDPPARPLQVAVLTGGRATPEPSLHDSRAHHLSARAELPDDALRLSDGPPAFTARLWPDEHAGT
jgi:nicotinate phosphoribosyltransferase